MPKGQRQELRFVCREYRGLEVLCARNAKGGNTLLGLRGEALSRLRVAAIAQLRGVSPLNWVLSVTATEPLSSFAAIPSGKQLERKTERNTFTKKSGQTVYIVCYHFNEEAKETMQEKINRMLVTEASRQKI